MYKHTNLIFATRFHVLREWFCWKFLLWHMSLPLCKFKSLFFIGENRKHWKNVWWKPWKFLDRIIQCFIFHLTTFRQFFVCVRYLHHLVWKLHYSFTPPPPSLLIHQHQYKLRPIDLILFWSILHNYCCWLMMRLEENWSFFFHPFRHTTKIWWWFWFALMMGKWR